MPARDHQGLDPRRRRLVDEALRADTALEEELELITSLFGSESRREFWRAFADGCDRRERPAAAVLDALERAAAR